MKANIGTLNQANKIVHEYNRICRSWELLEMENRLRSIGVTVGTVRKVRSNEFCGWESVCEWFMDGERVSGSWFVCFIAENENNPDKEYRMFFS